MSPIVFYEKSLVFWFHSHDAINESRASVHIGYQTPDDFRDAKIWLEPEIEIARSGQTLQTHHLRRAMRILKKEHKRVLEAWYDFRRDAGY